MNDDLLSCAIWLFLQRVVVCSLAHFEESLWPEAFPQQKHIQRLACFLRKPETCHYPYSQVCMTFIMKSMKYIFSTSSALNTTCTPRFITVSHFKQIKQKSFNMRKYQQLCIQSIFTLHGYIPYLVVQAAMFFGALCYTTKGLWIIRAYLSIHVLS